MNRDLEVLWLTGRRMSNDIPTLDTGIAKKDDSWLGKISDKVSSPNPSISSLANYPTSARVIAHLLEHLVNHNLVAFFFCRFDDQESRNARTIIRSIISQWLYDSPAATFRHYSVRNADEMAMVEFLEKALSHSRQYFIVVDGMDECEEDQIKELLEFFNRLLLSSFLQVKLFWSSSSYSHGWQIKTTAWERHDMGSIENREKVAYDIRKFIRMPLEDLLEGEVPKLRLGDPSIILTIVNQLEDKAQGM